MSLDVIATGRPRGTSSKLAVLAVRADDMRAMRKPADLRVLTAADSKKLAGCAGWPVARLIETIADSMDGAIDPASVGVFKAADGHKTDPISLAELAHGVLLHTAADGSALEAGGPLRLWLPAGVAVQPSACGNGAGPVNVKGVSLFDLSVPPAASAAATPAAPPSAGLRARD
eukprot:2707366-Prymnesium_polylepis.1